MRDAEFPGTTKNSAAKFQPYIRLRQKRMGSSYLRLYVLKRWRRDCTVADQEDVRLRVRERSQAVVVFLSGGIPQPQIYRLSVDHDVCRVIVKDRRDIFTLDTWMMKDCWPVARLCCQRRPVQTGLTGNAFCERERRDKSALVQSKEYESR